MVYGSWSDHHNWDSVTAKLAKTFRVLTYDRRGHSQSERQIGQGYAEEDIMDLTELINHFNLSPAHIVGNSYGASIVLKTAAKRITIEGAGHVPHKSHPGKYIELVKQFCLTADVVTH